MCKLNQSWVVFDEGTHTYTLNGKLLSGITGMLSRQLFPDKYKDIPEYILAKAAERGTAIHKDCEFADATGLPPQTTEGNNYLKLRDGYKVLANEYTVSDNDYFASNIDCVWLKENEISLADIKTTSQLDEEYLSWQLSIYAYLFELQNPHLKVAHLFGCWLRDDIAKLVEVERKTTEDIITLLNCEKEGKKYSLIQDKHELLAPSAINILIEAKQKAEEYTARYKEIEKQLLDAMALHKIKSWDTETLNRKLHQKGVQYKQSGQWVLYAKYQDKGYTKTITRTYTGTTGATHTSQLTVWTESGRQFIHSLF